LEIRLDDQRVFLADQGKGLDAGRPTVLFVHGAGMDHSVWPLQARHFAYRGWNALAIDLPGHGRSGGAPLGSIAAMADWLGRLIGALGVGRASLVGHSMGALATLACAAAHGERVERIALLGAAPAMPVHPDLLEAAGRPEPLAADLICDWAFGPAGHLGGHRAPGSWMLGHAQALLRRAAGPLLATDLTACNQFAGGLEAAAAVRCPALVIAGAADRMTPARQGAKLAEAIGGARLVTLPGCGHMMMVEQPDATLDALADFLVLAKR
jgi:pimeloyl-ACP methyl ester carboxylesterase